MITNQSQLIVRRGDYESFGEVAAITEDIENPLRFAGQFEDQESGLYYNLFRDYDPLIGRYGQADPIGLAGGDANVFAYANADPINRFDEDGLVGASNNLLPVLSELSTLLNERDVECVIALRSQTESARAGFAETAVFAASKPSKDDKCKGLRKLAQKAKRKAGVALRIALLICELVLGEPGPRPPDSKPPEQPPMHTPKDNPPRPPPKPE